VSSVAARPSGRSRVAMTMLANGARALTSSLSLTQRGTLSYPAAASLPGEVCARQSSITCTPSSSSSSLTGSKPTDVEPSMAEVGSPLHPLRAAAERSPHACGGASHPIAFERGCRPGRYTKIVEDPRR
jgi:hypothetical protein